jgi:hypothetical protein
LENKKSRHLHSFDEVRCSPYEALQLGPDQVSARLDRCLFRLSAEYTSYEDHGSGFRHYYRQEETLEDLARVSGARIKDCKGLGPACALELLFLMKKNGVVPDWEMEVARFYKINVPELVDDQQTYEEAQASADWADIGTATGLSEQQIRHLHALAIGYEICPNPETVTNEEDH